MQKNFVYPEWKAQHKDNSWFQLPQENLIINPAPSYLTINSADRDRSKWPSTSHFQIKFIDDAPGQPNGVTGKQYRNIQSVKLLSATIPQLNNVLDQPYLLLQVDEVQGMYDASTLPVSRAFSKLHFEPTPGPAPILRLDRGVGDPLTREFWPTPLASLDRLTLSIRTYNGDVFSFGTDGGDDIDPTLQTSFTFEIRNYVVDNRTVLGHRNI